MTIPDRFAPVLDILQDHHERRGHAGPVSSCVAPECHDALGELENSMAEYCMHCKCRRCRDQRSR